MLELVFELARKGWNTELTYMRDLAARSISTMEGEQYNYFANTGCSIPWDNSWAADPLVQIRFSTLRVDHKASHNKSLEGFTLKVGPDVTQVPH